MKAVRLLLLVLLFMVVGGVIGAYVWMERHTAPMPAGNAFYVRYSESKPSIEALREMQRRGVIRDAEAAAMIGPYRNMPRTVRIGTYEVRPGMTLEQLFTAFRSPIRQMVRIPETNWARRTANLLETKYSVGNAEDYMALVNRPEEFRNDVSFPLPARSLEGFLYPDTYDLPPLMSAREVIVRQLKAFDSKVWQGLNHPRDLARIVTVASLVELEAGTDEDRAMIAGVIENRIKKGMRLQIDATILYGMQKWRRLTFADYRNQKHPYNTYLIDGLPPGPICSPSLASIKAAMAPAVHPYVYYVAMPDGHTIYARSYAGHRENIRRRLAAIKARQGSR